MRSGLLAAIVVGVIGSLALLSSPQSKAQTPLYSYLPLISRDVSTPSMTPRVVTVVVTATPSPTTQIITQTVVVTQTVLVTSTPPPTETSTATPTQTDTPSPTTAPIPKLFFRMPNQTVSEGIGTLITAVELSSPLEQDVELSYTITGSALGGSDYSPPPGKTRIVRGNLGELIVFDILDDQIDEDDETLIITFDQYDGIAFDEMSVLTITIKDNDTAPTIQFSSPTHTTTPITSD